MVSPKIVASYLGLIVPVRGFVTPFVTRIPNFEIAARAPAARPYRTTRGNLCMRKTPKFVVSEDAKARQGPLKVTMNIKTGEIIKEEMFVKRTAKKPTASSSDAGAGVAEKIADKGPGVTEPKIDLYCKAGADGESLGDCPFTHYVQMVLHYKDLPFKMHPCTKESKPEWLAKDYGGQMPCLTDNGEVYTESEEIVKYLEYFYPSPTLSLEKQELVEEARAATSGVFGALARCIKNTDLEADPQLIAAVTEELGKVDAHLKETGGPFLTGEDVTLADCSFAPKLYHASTCLAHFKNTVIPPEMESLRAYMDHITSFKEFSDSSYPPDVVVWGWNNARGTVPK